MGRQTRTGALEEHHYLLTLDPSGNFYEGKGTTGWCLFRDKVLIKAGQIYAKDAPSQVSYWHAVVSLIANLYKTLHFGEHLEVVCEDYRLYAHKAQDQINSNLETPQLIGIIKYECYLRAVPVHLQMAHEVKNRWSDEVLYKTGRFKKEGKHVYADGVLIEHHSKDAYRHGLHYILCKMTPSSETPKIDLAERSNY